MACIILLVLFFFPAAKARDYVGFEKPGSPLTLSNNLPAVLNSNNAPRRDSISVPTFHMPEDDQEFNKKYPLWIPLVDVVGINSVINLVDRYILDIKYVRISLNSWGNNLRAGWPWGPGWIWDHDPFSNNFLFHPISGAFYYNAARSNGYNLYEALPVTLFGSYMWKIFGENGKPEREDLINSTISGVFIGEVTYRLSSDILDDRTMGSERMVREIGAGIIDPVRAINRLLQGKSSRVTTKEVYQKEPLDIRVYLGYYFKNRNADFGTGNTSGISGIHLDYGDPYEDRSRKPYDFFRIEAELDFAKGAGLLDKARGYALLYGFNAAHEKLEILAGAFQHFDYYDNKSIELATIGFGPGLISRMALPGDINLCVDLHAAGVPFGANTTRYGPYSAVTKDYDLVGGMEAKEEIVLAIGDRVRATLNGTYFLTHTYVGNIKDDYAKTNCKVTMVNPGVEFRLFRNIGIGFEHLIYYFDRNPDVAVNVNVTRTEQKLYLTFYSGNNRRGQ